jgi:RES domain-containing protein
MRPFDGLIWRILAADRVDEPLGAARAPEGRFHHSGQRALYASLSPEGAGVAIDRYVREEPQVARVIVPLRVRLSRVRDLRAEPSPERASVVWQEDRKAGVPSPTWSYSDAARDAGAEAMIYLSRSRPDLAHIVLFAWTAGATIWADGAARDWFPQTLST